MQDEVRTQVARYYKEKLEAYGPEPRGVDWNSDASQQIRFKQLMTLLPEHTTFSVNDLGCGYGALATFLLQHVTMPFNYFGYDICAEMVEQAARSFQQPTLHFYHGNELKHADYTVASGIFNVMLDQSRDSWEAYIHQTLDDMDHASQNGFAFNMLTRYSDSDKMQPHLYYGDPCYYFDLVKQRYAKQVALFHHYGLYEFTILALKQG